MFCSTVFQGKRPKCWNTMATSRLGSRTSVPPMVTRPPSRGTSPSITRRRVVLPQPEGPTTHRHSPALTSRSSPSKTSTPVEKRLVALSTVMELVTPLKGSDQERLPLVGALGVEGHARGRPGVVAALGEGRQPGRHARRRGLAGGKVPGHHRPTVEAAWLNQVDLVVVKEPE